MIKNRKISSKEFDYLTSLDPVLPKDDRKGYKSLKYALMDTVEGVFGDRWHNLKEGTRQAIEYICFLSLDRGFAFPSPEHLRKKFGIGVSTVYRNMEPLIESGVVIRRNFSSKKHNGCGNAIYIFTNHPMFEQISNYLCLDEKANENANEKADEAEIPHESKEVGVLRAPTLPLPTHYQKQKHNNDIHINVLPDSRSTEIKRIVKYVPKVINDLYANIFGESLRNIWVKIAQAFKTIKHSILGREDLYHFGKIIIQHLFSKRKELLRKGREMSLDDMCAYVYKTAIETFYNAMAEVYMETYEQDMETYYSEKADQLDQAISVIPVIEDQYVKDNPYACFERVVSEVVKLIKVYFPLLDRNDIEYLENSYTLFSGQREMVREYYEFMKSG